MSEGSGHGTGTTILSWFDEPAKQSVNAVFKSLNEGVEALDLFRKFRNAQFRYIREQTLHIKILGMAEPQELPKVYTAARLSTSIARRLYRKERLEQDAAIRSPTPAPAQPKRPDLNAEEYIESQARTVVLGGPGSGKTTLLKHLSLAYANREVFDKTKLRLSLLPIFVSLPTLVAAKCSLEDFIAQPLIHKTGEYARGYLRRAMEKGLAAVFLDSLDEVPVQERNAVIRNIAELARLYPELKIVVTCRTADYDGGLDSFVEVEITRLTSQAVLKIIRAWFSGDPSKGEQLIRLLRADRGVLSLTETPLLLSLLCIQFAHDLALPKRKAELYRRCVDTLLRDWDTTRRFRRDTAYAQLTDERKERIYEHVACHYFLDGVKLNFPAVKLQDVVGTYIERFGLAPTDAAAVIDEIERHHGILEKVSAESYSFSHTSFQEYFVARTLVSRRLEMDCLKGHYDDDNWSGVIEFVVAIQEDPQEVLAFLVQKCSMTALKTSYPAMARRTKLLWLIYRCLCAGAAITKAFRSEVLRQLFDAQIEMNRIYRTGGVAPVAVLQKDGVRHPLFMSNRRDTLTQALQPYRMLGNEMIFSPFRPYAEYVLGRVVEVDQLAIEDEFKSALKLCLVIPLASVMPDAVEQHVRIIIKATPKSHPLQKVLTESMEALNAHYLPSDDKRHIRNLATSTLPGPA